MLHLAVALHLFPVLKGNNKFYGNDTYSFNIFLKMEVAVSVMLWHVPLVCSVQVQASTLFYSLSNMHSCPITWEYSYFNSFPIVQ